jgi:hypothetical protein
MDASNLSSDVVALLTPYLQRLAGKLTDQLAEAAVPAIGRLHDALRRRLAPTPYAAGQLAGLEERPEIVGRQQALASALSERLAEDPELADELRRLVGAAQVTDGSLVVGKVEGPAAFGGSVQQTGRYVAGHDLVINPRDDDP